MKILVIDNNDSTVLSFRKELIDELIVQYKDIYLAGSFSSEELFNTYKNKLKIFSFKSKLRSLSIFKNIANFLKIQKIIKEVQPDVVLSFTIKPNIYSNFKKHQFISIANITGLGASFNNIFTRTVAVLLYKISFKNVTYVFFQNGHILDTFESHHIPHKNHLVVPGSGVNCERFALTPLTKNKGTRFLFPSRFLKDKGFNLLLECIPEILKSNPDSKFIFSEKGKKSKVKCLGKLINEYPDNVEHISGVTDIRELYKNTDFTVSPSYYNEGISNVLLESLSCGRPIITTQDNPGCKEVLQDNINGFGVVSKNKDSLLNALNKACSCSKEQIIEMGKKGREFVSEHFDRKTVIKTYIDKINELTKK